MSTEGQALLFDVPEDPEPTPKPKAPRPPMSDDAKAKATATKRRQARREARAARDAGIAKGKAGAEPVWLAEAEKAVRRVSSGGKRFTADDVMAILEGVGVKTRDKRALGGVMDGMRRRGEVVPLMEFVATSRKSRHAAPIRVWQGAV